MTNKEKNMRNETCATDQHSNCHDVVDQKSSVLPLHLEDQVLLSAPGLLRKLWAPGGQMFHDLLERPKERMMSQQNTHATHYGTLCP